MSDENVRIFRVRIVEHEVQEYIDMPADEYKALIDELGLDESDDVANTIDFQDALDTNKYYDAWITDWSEPVDDRISDVWIGSQDD